MWISVRAARFWMKGGLRKLIFIFFLYTVRSVTKNHFAWVPSRQVFSILTRLHRTTTKTKSLSWTYIVVICFLFDHFAVYIITDEQNSLISCIYSHNYSVGRTSKAIHRRTAFNFPIVEQQAREAKNFFH